MQPKITFCCRCRGIRVGWNQRYILHCLLCKRWFHHSSRVASLAVLTAALLILFPVPSASVYSYDRTEPPIQQAGSDTITVKSVSPAVRSIDAFLKHHEVGEAQRSRLAESIVDSARKYDVSPRLIASVIIVESRGNPFAISNKNAIGIMQIHLPTWGKTADREGINLFKIEDNIDLGTRILRDYVRQFGLWQGVKRYNGFIASDPASVQVAEDYVGKVQRVYDFQHSSSSQTDRLQ